MSYVLRWNPKAARGRWHELVEVLKNQRDSLGEGTVARIYTNVFGDADQIIAEIEFPDIESAAKAYEATFDDEQEAQLRESGWYDIVASQRVEIWKLVD
ncbi:MAG: hypothetical protein AAF614_41145 [Chloroflexota bacterium]